MLTQKLPNKIVPNFHILEYKWSEWFQKWNKLFSDNTQLWEVFSLVYYDYKLLISLVKQCQATLNAWDLAKYSVKHSWNLSNL